MHDPVDAWSLAAITERLEGDWGVSYQCCVPVSLAVALDLRWTPRVDTGEKASSPPHFVRAA